MEDGKNKRCLTVSLKWSLCLLWTATAKCWSLGWGRRFSSSKMSKIPTSFASTRSGTSKQHVIRTWILKQTPGWVIKMQREIIIRNVELKSNKTRMLQADHSYWWNKLNFLNSANVLLLYFPILSISYCVCNVISNRAGPQKEDQHKQAPAHKSSSLMSELIGSPSGHLQVINVSSGCQVTPHLNKHSLWNTNGNTRSFVRLTRGSVWKQRWQKRVPSSRCIEGALRHRERSLAALPRHAWNRQRAS